MQLNPFKKKLGLDISDQKIRFTEIEDARHGKSMLLSFGEISVPPGLIVAGEISNEAAVVELIKKIIKKPALGRVTTTFTNASLPEKRIFIKVVQIPNVPENEQRGAVSWAIEQNIPVNIDQVYFDWHILSTKHQPDADKLQIVVSVAPKNLVDSYSSLITKCGLTLVGLENESVAITRCLIDADITELRHSLLVIDLGRSRTNIMILGGDTVEFASTIDVSGHEMTQAVAKLHGLSYTDAEKAKIIYGLDPKKGRGTIKKVLEPILTQLVTKIQENLDFYSTYLSPSNKINTILLTGSVSQMLNLPIYLGARLKTSVFIGDPWMNIKLTGRHTADSLQNFQSFTTAIGLALKKFDD